MAKAFIGLGSNLGDRQAYLNAAMERLAQLPETQLLQTSRWHETDPVGGPPQGRYLNGVAEAETGLKPLPLLKHLQQIERELGRPEVHPRWDCRVIDLDLIAYNGLTLESPWLVLPHPRMHTRPFVLLPLAELAPAWRHPRLGKTVAEILQELERSHGDRQTSEYT